MRAWLSIAALLLLTGCSSNPPFKYEADGYGDIWMHCLNDAVHSLDDGRSDPATIGIAVAGKCAGPQEAYAQAVGRSNGLYGAELLSFTYEMRPHGLEMATRVVLEERSRVRVAPPQPAAPPPKRPVGTTI